MGQGIGRALGRARGSAQDEDGGSTPGWMGGLVG